MVYPSHKNIKILKKKIKNKYFVRKKMVSGPMVYMSQKTEMGWKCVNSIDTVTSFLKAPTVSNSLSRAIHANTTIPINNHTLSSPFYSKHSVVLTMQSLQQKASEWSGVSTDEAFSIDETNLFQKLGLQTFINLSTNFYNRYQSINLCSILVQMYIN